jgi:hypothetical protein
MIRRIIIIILAVIFIATILLFAFFLTIILECLNQPTETENEFEEEDEDTPEAELPCSECADFEPRLCKGGYCYFLEDRTTPDAKKKCWHKKEE